MSDKLKRLSARKVIRKLERAGFEKVYQKGSHLYLKSEDGTRTVIVPVHGSKDIPTGTLFKLVVRQAGLSVEEFNDL